MHDELTDLSAAFVEQANTLAEKLPPGGVAVINVPPCAADELILLGGYCKREDLVMRVSHLPPTMLDYLLTISNDDGLAPVLVWLHDGNIISINRANFSVGVNLTINSWKLEGLCEIKVIKEKESPNGFLSISFVDSEGKRLK